MWAMNKAVGAAALQPDPESGSLSQKVFAIPRSNWPRRVTTIAAASARIRVGVVDSAVAVMPTRLPQSEPNDEQQAQGSRHEPGADAGDQGVHHYSSRVPGRFCQRLTVHGRCSRTTPRSLPSPRETALAWAWRCPGGRVIVVLGREAERAARRALSLRTKSLSPAPPEIGRASCRERV